METKEVKQTTSGQFTEPVERFEGWMLAKSTIHHGGNEKTGSTPVLRTIYMAVVDERGVREVPIPYIHGNAIRGKLRRLMMREFLMLLGLNPEELNLKLYHVLFTGGALESNEGNYATVDLPLRRRIKSLLKPLALFGGAIGNQMIQGVLKVGHAFPVCQEYAMYLPEFLRSDERAKMPVRVFTDESFQTRRDDLKAERAEDEQAVQMKVDYECLIPGTKLYHWFSLEWADDIERSCFGRLIELFRSAPFIGGKGSTGNGEVVFEYQPGVPSAQQYLEFVLTKRDEIVELIRELEGIL